MNRYHQGKAHVFGIMIIFSLFIVSGMLYLAAPRSATMQGVQIVTLTARESGNVITQKGDTVNFSYTGTYDNGTIFDHGIISSQIIGNNNLLAYFDQNLAGREAGVQFSFAIPPEYGYQSGRYQGLTLHFQVTITQVLRGGKVLYPTSLSISSPADITYVNGATGNSISWTITASSTGTKDYIIYRNGTIVTTGSWTSGSPVSITIDGLAVGVYNYTINAMDSSAGQVQDTVIVTVSAGITDGYPVAVVGMIVVATILILTKKRNRIAVP